MAPSPGTGDNRSLASTPHNHPNGNGPRRHWPWAWLILALLVAATVVVYRDTGSTANGVVNSGQSGISTDIYGPLSRSERIFSTATTLSAIADTADERAYSEHAQHLADELLDTGFTVALQQAAATPRAQANPNSAEQLRVKRAEAAVQADEQAVAGLQGSGSATNAGTNGAAAGELAVAVAQLALDRARLADARNDASEGQQGAGERLQELQQEHEAVHNVVKQSTAGDWGQLAAEAANRNPIRARGLVGELRAAWLLQQKIQRLRAAEAQVRAAIPDMRTRHNQLHQSLQRQEAELQSAAPGLSHEARVARLHALEQLQEQISRFDQQSDLATELADTYHSWIPLAQQQRNLALHRGLRDLLVLLGLIIVLGVMLTLVERIFHRTSWERKRAMTLRHVLRLSVEIVAALVGLLIFFGQPTQLFTVIGLAGAGLAVAFQDAILSVAGWFVLMGHSGVHLGDWVEINGVVGEVIEIRLLKTVLMETGNWITAGHPTGRRVFFPNSFALKGSYFNYSTVGQWLWDEVEVQLPAGMDAHRAASEVEQALQKELREPSERASHEWQHWQRDDVPYSTEPTVQLRPEGGQFNLVVRYTTPAQERSAMRERLWRVITHGVEEAARPRSQEATPG